MDWGLVLTGIGALIAAIAAIAALLQARAANDALADAREARDAAAKHERAAMEAASRAATAQERSASALERQAAIAEEATTIAKMERDSEAERTTRRELTEAQSRRRDLVAPVIEWQNKLSHATLHRRTEWMTLANAEAQTAAARLNLDGESGAMKRVMEAAIEDAVRSMRARGPEAPQRVPRFFKARERRILRTRVAFAEVVRAWVQDPDAAVPAVEAFLAEHPKQWDRNWKDEFKE